MKSIFKIRKAAEKLLKFIDAHIHLLPKKMLSNQVLTLMKSFFQVDPNFYLQISQSPDNLIKYLDQHNVEAVAIMSYPAPDVMGWGDELVDSVAEYTKHHPDRLLFFCSVHPRLEEKPVERLEHLYSKYEVKGIKLHPVHQLFKPNAYRPEEQNMKTLDQIYQFAVDHNLPVLFHTGTSIFPKARNKYGDPLFLDDVATDYPKMKIIMSHGGRPIWMKTATFLLRRHPNIILDISSIPPQKITHYFPNIEKLADKAIFGSDWPGPGVSTIHGNIQQLLNTNLTQPAKKKILYENAAKLLLKT
ncbi:MAG: amidohydrolase family protein [Candidatus Freyarchaeota archaeon]|nr:amidohydrolase family protein [Candidatus Freyrarchaeum guaymaensis]HDO80191.1 amidohydrolase [Candidatus Bathyarchaeota archaeon]